MAFIELQQADWKSYFDNVTIQLFQNGQPQYKLRLTAGIGPSVKSLSYDPTTNTFLFEPLEYGENVPHHPTKIEVEEDETGFPTSIRVHEGDDHVVINIYPIDG